MHRHRNSVVQKWFRISLVLSLTMGAAFIVALLRNYFASDLFHEDYTLPFIIYLSPALIRATYFSVKKHFESNKAKIESIGGSLIVYDYDLFVVAVIKLNLVLAFLRLIPEVVGRNASLSLLEHLSPQVRLVISLFLGV